MAMRCRRLHRGHDQIVQRLLEKRADVNVQGGKYGNALYAASYEGSRPDRAAAAREGGTGHYANTQSTLISKKSPLQIYCSADTFRDSFNSNCASLGFYGYMVQLLATKVRYSIAVAHFLTYIGPKNLVLDLMLALQTLLTARLLPSPNNRGTLFGDLSKFNSVVDSDDFDIKSVVILGPMLQRVISVTEVNPVRVPRALEGEVGVVVASRGVAGTAPKAF
jgi:hypothetical protein